MIPHGATHTLRGTYYRKATQGGMYIWCQTHARWRYMEDRTMKAVLREAQRLEEMACPFRMT